MTRAEIRKRLKGLQAEIDSFRSWYHCLHQRNPTVAEQFLARWKERMDRAETEIDALKGKLRAAKSPTATTEGVKSTSAAPK